MPLFLNSIHFSVIYCGNNLNMQYLKVYICWTGGKDESRGKLCFCHADIFQRLPFLSVHNCKSFDHCVVIVQVCREQYNENDWFLFFSLLPLLGPCEACEHFRCSSLKLIKVSRETTWQKKLFPSCKILSSYRQYLSVYLWVKGMKVENQTLEFQKWLNWDELVKTS